MGRMKAAVFPEPVGAQANNSRPCHGGSHFHPQVQLKLNTATVLDDRGILNKQFMIQGQLEGSNPGSLN